VSGDIRVRRAPRARGSQGGAHHSHLNHSQTRTDCAVSASGPLLARLSRCAPRASAAQHHALDTLLDASPPNPGTDVNEPEAATDTALAAPSASALAGGAEGADTVAAHPRTVRFMRLVSKKEGSRKLLDDEDGDDEGDDDDDDEYEECEDGEQGCEEVEVEE
jgi:hypothetical protein